jgi:pyruvate dehydrogenase (quinone)
MACAHAKFTDMGVYFHLRPPAIFLTALHANSTKNVLAIIGQQATFSLGTDFQQEVDLISLFKDVAHQYVHMASSPAQIRHLVDRSVRIAKATRSVTCIFFPTTFNRWMR